MKQFFVSEDGKQFDSQIECVEYEFQKNKKNELFIHEISSALEYLSSHYDLTFRINDILVYFEIDSSDPNSTDEFYTEWQQMSIDVIVKGEKRGETYIRYSNTGFYNKENVISEIISEYISPYSKKIEGVLTENGDIYASGFDLNRIKIDYILKAMNGKRVRIEIIE